MTTAPQGTPHLATRSLTLGYDQHPVVRDLDLEIPPGRITAIIGANGCGKSTLLRALARLLRPRTGDVVLDGRALHRIPTREIARMLGLLPQSPIAPEGIAVADLVGRGRHPHRGALSRWSTQDDEAVAQALAATDTADLADRCVDELSGGQRQRVWIAMALAQQTDVLLLDEPTTFLDVAHQVEVLDLLTDLNHDRGTTVVMVLHDMNMAARYADHVIALRRGAVVAAGAPARIMTADLIREVFDIESLIVEDPTSGAPIVLPRGRHHDLIPAARSTA